MGDLSEMRGIIVIISFLAMYVLLVGQIPPLMYVSGELPDIWIPEQFQGIDLQAFGDTWNDTTIYLEFSDFEVGGRNMRIASQYTDNRIMLIQRYGLGLLWLEGGTWYNRDNIAVSYLRPEYPHLLIGAEVLDQDYNEFDSVEFTVRFAENQPFQFKTFFTWNDSLYVSPSEAWEHDALGLLIGINFDQIGTTYNAWDIIAMLLTFQLPDIHWVINAMLVAPIWAVIGYLCYVLVLKAIPLLGS